MSPAITRHREDTSGRYIFRERNRFRRSDWRGRPIKIIANRAAETSANGRHRFRYLCAQRRLIRFRGHQRRWPEIKVLPRRFRGRPMGVAKYQAVRTVIECVTAAESARRPIITLYESLADRHSLVNRSCNCWLAVAGLSSAAL